MFWDVVLVRFFKIAVVAIIAIAMDYAFFDGRTTQQVAAALEEFVADSWAEIRQLGMGILNLAR
jgi:hypothetical protein